MSSVRGRIWAVTAVLLTLSLGSSAWAVASTDSGPTATPGARGKYGLDCAVVALDQQRRDRSSGRATRDCAPSPSHDGFRKISWALYPDEPPDPASNSIVVAVHERSCTGGRNPIPYLQPPEVRYLKKAVVVTLWIEVLEGVYTCPGNPIGRLKVKLPGPLGNRQPYDGSTNPPRKVKPGEDPRRRR
jgi:hypothetical protein